MLITNNNSWDYGVRKRTIGQDFKIGPISLRFIAIALVAIAALFYLAQSTQASVNKYRIMQLCEQQSQLEVKTADLEVEAARLKSLNEIKKNSENLNLEPTEKIIYNQSTSN